MNIDKIRAGQKRYLFLLFALLLCLPTVVCAQDVIVRKNGNRIEAFVREITPEVVRYNLPSDPNGKRFFIYRDLISSIVYANGKTVKFDGTKMETIDAPVETVKPTLTEIERPRQERTQNPVRESEPDKNSLAKSREEQTFRFNDQLTEADIQQIFSLPTSLDIYRKSQSFSSTGTWMIVGGAVLALAPVGCMVAEKHYDGTMYFDNFFGKKQYPVKKVAKAVGIAGGVILVGGIGLKIYSIQLKNEAKTVKNISYGGEHNRRSSIDFGLTGNGVGFVMNF
jgi:hypothetical protein